MTTIFSDEPIIQIPKKSIFLAGPTSRDNIFEKSWRKDAVDLLNKAGFDGTVCIPEFKAPRPFREDDWEAQVAWEWALLDSASCILFWVDRALPEMPGFTTNLEFGTYLQKCPEKVILAYPESACKMEWMALRYKLMTGQVPAHTLSDAIELAIHTAERI